MKTINLNFTAILLIMAGLCSCSPADRLEKELEKEPEEPVTVPLTEYSLEGTGCQWTNLGYDSKVIIINSREDLEKYLTCTEGDFPEVDFSEHTLLLASGRDKDVINIDTVSLEYAANEYTVKVTVYSGSAAETVNWDVAVLTSKIPDGVNITLEKEIEEDKSDSIELTEYSLVGTGCSWIDLALNEVTVINSNEDLEKYIACTEGSYPNIDFSTNTLLLASGEVTDGISNVFRKSLTFDSYYNYYMLRIELKLNETMLVPYWTVAILTKKLRVGVDVELVTFGDKKPVNLESGMYSETYPNQGRTKINVIDENRLEITYKEVISSYTNVYKYEIRGSFIILIPVDYPEISLENYFRIINNSKFRIGNLYYSPAIGGRQPSMIFEK